MFSIATASSDENGLSIKYYDRVCPQALPTIKRVVEDAVAQERRMGASLLRLHFHDCFVNVSNLWSQVVNFICALNIFACFLILQFCIVLSEGM